MNFREIFAKIQAIVGNLFLLFHALCGTVFSRFSSLGFTPAVDPCAKSSFYRENILFDHVASLCPGKTAGSRSVRVRAICAYVTGRRNAPAKVFCAFSHARTTVKTRNVFSLLRAFFEQYAHIASGFATTPSYPARANAHYARATCRTFRRTHPLRSSCICFAKMRRTFPLAKAQKRDRPSFFAKKASPMSFLAARHFSGARKQIPLFAYFIDNSGYRSERAVANGCFCRYFGLSRVHRFFPRLRACFEK